MIKTTQLNRLLISLFDIKRRTKTPDNQGGNTFIYEKIGEVRGRMSNDGKSSESKIAGHFSGLTDHIFFCLPGIDIKRDDLLVGEGKTFRVIYLREPSEGNHHLEIDCEEVDPISHQIGS